LPPEVSLTGQIEPQKLTFDPQTREILWEIGDLPAGAGIEEPYQIAFQIRFKPNQNQIDSFATLINKATLTGIDQWTDQELTIETPALTTEVFGEEQGKITK